MSSKAQSRSLADREETTEDALESVDGLWVIDLGVARCNVREASDLRAIRGSVGVMAKGTVLREMHCNCATVPTLYASFCEGRPQKSQMQAAACLSQMRREAGERGLRGQRT